MANILDLQTVGNYAVIVVDADPASGAGTPGAISTIAIFDSGSVGSAYVKVGAADTAWDKIATSQSGPVLQGQGLRLALYPTAGYQLDDQANQNGQTIEAAFAAQPGRTAPITYTIPNPGNAITSVNFVLSEGIQTINGAKTFTSPINMNNQAITSVQDPTNAQDAATKNYVDSVATGLDAKPSVRAATSTNITLSGLQNIDGITLNAGDRVLVKSQTNPAQNGIYVASGSAWTRALDMDAWTEVPSAFVFVEEGVTFGDTGWVCINDAGGTLGTTGITFTQFSGAGTYTAGNGLNLTGSQFSANLDANGALEFNSGAIRIKLDAATLARSANGLKVAPGGITDTEIAALAAISLSKLAALTASRLLVSNASGVISPSAGNGFVKVTTGTPSYQSTIGLGSDVSGTLPITNGGTGLSALGTANQLLGANGAASAAEYKTLAGTTNRVLVTFAAGLITLSLPQDIHTGAAPTFAGLTLSNLTPGSVPFAGASGVLSQDNAALFWDAANKRLGIGTATPSVPLDVNGAARVAGPVTIAAADTYLVQQAAVNSVDATVTTLATYTIPNNTQIMIEARVNGTRTGGTSGTAGDGAIYIRHARIKNVGGVLTIKDLQSSYTSEDQVGWNCIIDVSGTTARVRVTGAANNNITWKATIIVNQG